MATCLRPAWIDYREFEVRTSVYMTLTWQNQHTGDSEAAPTRVPRLLDLPTHTVHAHFHRWGNRGTERLSNLAEPHS